MKCSPKKVWLQLSASEFEYLHWIFRENELYCDLTVARYSLSSVFIALYRRHTGRILLLNKLFQAFDVGCGTCLLNPFLFHKLLKCTRSWIVIVSPSIQNILFVETNLIDHALRLFDFMPIVCLTYQGWWLYAKW